MMRVGLASSSDKIILGWFRNPICDRNQNLPTPLRDGTLTIFKTGTSTFSNSWNPRRPSTNRSQKRPLRPCKQRLLMHSLSTKGAKTSRTKLRQNMRGQGRKLFRICKPITRVNLQLPESKTWVFWWKSWPKRIKFKRRRTFLPIRDLYMGCSRLKIIKLGVRWWSRQERAKTTLY